MVNALQEAAQRVLSAWDTRAGIGEASEAFEALREALVASQQVKQWHSLTDEEIGELFENYKAAPKVEKFLRIFEIALRDKNCV